MTMMALSKIRTDGGTQTRANFSDETLAEYTAIIAAGGELPHVDVFDDGKDSWLGDGFQRHAAYTNAGRTEIPVTIHKGTQRDAVLFAVGSNAEHGARRTNDDKRKAIRILLEDDEWTQCSDNWIAQKCKVSDGLVTTVRALLFKGGSTSNSGSSSEKATNRKGKDGKQRPSRKGHASSSKVSKKNESSSNEDNGDTQSLCKRCRRIGAASCPKCIAAQTKKGEGAGDGKRGEGEAKKTKPGAACFNFADIEGPMGKLVRALDDCGGKHGKGTSYHGLLRVLQDFAEKWKSWKKELMELANA